MKKFKPKYMRTIFILSFFISFSLSAFCQDWTKEINKDWQKSQEMAITINYKDAIICGMPLDKFYKYYTQGNKVSDEYLDILFDRFCQTLTKNILGYSNKKQVSPNYARFELVFYIKEITDNAGYTGYFYINDKLENCSTKYGIKYTCPDGKWNSFDKLLIENAEKAMKNMKSYANPFTYPFHKDK